MVTPEVEEAMERLAEAKRVERNARNKKFDAAKASEDAHTEWGTAEALVVDAWQTLQNAINEALEPKAEVKP